MSKRNIEKKCEIQKNIVLKQIREIEQLKKQIEDLEIDCKKKEDMINSIEDLHVELDSIIRELKSKNDEYDELISELKEMKNVITQTVFKGKWKLIRFLLR